jgi:hypothetical protein
MMDKIPVRKFGPVVLLMLGLGGGSLSWAGDAPATNSDWVTLVLKLPSSHYTGTPPNAPPGTTVNVMQDQADAPVRMPKDARNIAPRAKVTCSDKNATRDDLAKLTDGDKEAEGDSVLQLHKGLQWVQFDFGSPQEIYAVAIWHAHESPKICQSVIVQVADDVDFTENVRSLFNNDRENKAGLGAGTDRQYFETYKGKTINANGVHARYLRLYSDGSTQNHLNEYTEVEVYGRPVK